MSEEFCRKLPVGAEMLPKGGVHFRVWAPARKKVELVLEDESQHAAPLMMHPEPGGYFSVASLDAAAGTLYRYRLDGGEAFPDPASRFQPSGPHGPSRVIDPTLFEWTDREWKGISLEGQVIYEMHVGSFTSEGTFQRASDELSELAELGITVIEIMPVADFAGTFGWGYDGVDLYAPTRLYGNPDDFRRFVNKAHAQGIGVILDVVYNHLGPEGNYLRQFSEHYFSTCHKTDWGEAINYDGDFSQPVREFFSLNAAYWIDEFHLDGLRLDSTPDIFDDSEEHILRTISRKAREAAKGRSIVLIAESESQQVKLIKPVELGGYGLDAVWNDDFHHTVMVAITGRKEAYYTDYFGTPQELISTVKWGYLYQGQYYTWLNKLRGTPALEIRPAAFVTFIQNHDQIANSCSGLRCHQMTSPGAYRAVTALMLLGPGTPMLFQGQEFASSAPFLYFADHQPELTELVFKGRKEFLCLFPSTANQCRPFIMNPSDPETFRRCVLDFSERETHNETYRLHKDLLNLRQTEPAFRRQHIRGVDGAALGPRVFVLRFFEESGRDMLLIVNLGIDLNAESVPEPLLAPPEGKLWKIVWSSESPQYGGMGNPSCSPYNWVIAGNSAVVLCPVPVEEKPAG